MFVVGDSSQKSRDRRNLKAMLSAADNSLGTLREVGRHRIDGNVHYFL